MVSENAATVCLLLATVATGLQAGLYYAFSCSVMPGLARGDDRTFVTAMHHINAAIINPWFMATFFGAPLLSALAALLHVVTGQPAAWVMVGFGLAAATFVSTIAVNVPLNNALDAAGPPDQVADPGSVRAKFEARWVRWNLVRAVTSTGSLLALSWASIAPWQAQLGRSLG